MRIASATLRFSTSPSTASYAAVISSHGLTTKQYARLVHKWVAGIGLDPAKFGTHSLRPAKAVLIYRRTGNLLAVQLLRGHERIDSTARYPGIEGGRRHRACGEDRHLALWSD